MAPRRSSRIDVERRVTSIASRLHPNWLMRQGRVEAIVHDMVIGLAVGSGRVPPDCVAIGARIGVEEDE